MNAHIAVCLGLLGVEDVGADDQAAEGVPLVIRLKVSSHAFSDVVPVRAARAGQGANTDLAQY